MKKISLLLAVILLLFSLVGCTSKSGVSVDETVKSDDNSITHKYEMSSETIKREFTLKEGETGSFTIDVVTESGTIAMDIVDGGGNSIFSENDIKTSTVTAQADKSGKYSLTIITNDHKGSFNVILNVNK